jgi:hypothetical protein
MNKYRTDSDTVNPQNVEEDLTTGVEEIVAADFLHSEAKSTIGVVDSEDSKPLHKSGDENDSNETDATPPNNVSKDARMHGELDGTGASKRAAALLHSQNVASAPGSSPDRSVIMIPARHWNETPLETDEMGDDEEVLQSSTKQLVASLPKESPTTNGTFCGA